MECPLLDDRRLTSDSIGVHVLSVSYYLVAPATSALAWTSTGARSGNWSLALPRGFQAKPVFADVSRLKYELSLVALALSYASIANSEPWSTLRWGWLSSA